MELKFYGVVLSGFGDSRSFAVRIKFTLTAIWRNRSAKILTESHKNIVYGYPVLLRKFLTKGKLG